VASAFKIESLLSARLCMAPQLAGERLYFISDLSGRLSLYAMDRAGSVPEPLLPRDIALQNPHLLGGEAFVVFPGLDKILVMVDRDGDENYQPMFIPLAGGIPEPAFGERFARQQVSIERASVERNLAVLHVDRRIDPVEETFLVDLTTGVLISLGESVYGNHCVGANEDFTAFALIDSYTVADEALYLWRKGGEGRRLIYGKPLEARTEGEVVPLNAIHDVCFTLGDRGLLFVTSLFSDQYGLAYITAGAEGGAPEPKPVAITGTVHQGAGELERLEHLTGTRYLLVYNIDGASYAYEGTFDEPNRRLMLDKTLCGVAKLADGTLEHIAYDRASGDYVVSFSTATSPTQIYTLDGPDRLPFQHTRERVLGIPTELLAPGEDASYVSHDGLRVSARLYLPAAGLGFTGPRPVVFYIHGGPQGQERPDFAWFSMALIQFFTLNGFAVFVPNVRGSTGYGLDYVKRVDGDWGGLDRLDHVAAYEHLHGDPRLDLDRAGVMGRSYGGYMTLTLAGRHPELWRAAVDMFGPYNLLSFLDRIPETWKTYYHMALGHPERDRDFLIERSPSTYLSRLACPMLVIQGHNDPRVREAESRDLVETLRGQGKEIELLVFPNEGHDVLKYENKTRCYNDIVDFFTRYLKP
jgi:pimeloyl-ACP methyl ester carboxylesterase